MNGLLATIFALVAFAAPLTSTLEVIVSGRLPTPRIETAVFYDGDDSVYIYGGYINGSSVVDEALRYTLKTGVVEVVSDSDATRGLFGTDGSGKYYFISTNKDTIFEVTEQDPRPVPVSSLPAYRRDFSVGSDMTGDIYIFGGHNSSSYTDGIYRFNSKTKKVDNYHNLPVRVAGSTASSVTRSGIFIFGGITPDAQNANIVKFVPELGYQILAETLPAGLTGAASVTIGTDIYLIGGHQVGIEGFSLKRFDTVTEKVEDLEVVNFTTKIMDASAIYISRSNRIYVFGGTRNSASVFSDEIFYIQL